MTRFFTISIKALLSLIMVALAVAASPAYSKSLEELNAELQTLSAIENDLLIKRSDIQRNLDDPDIIFLDMGNGAIEAMRRDDMISALNIAIGVARYAGLTDLYLQTLAPFDRSLAEFAISSGLAASDVVDSFAQRDRALRKEQTRRIARINEILASIRQWAGETLIERNAERDRVDFGDGPDVFTTNPACSDESVPTDRYAVSWARGYGVSGRMPVKGDYICTAYNTYSYVSEGYIYNFSCEPNNLRQCIQTSWGPAEPSTDRDGNPILITGESSTITFFPDP